MNAYQQHELKFRRLKSRFAICRLPAGEKLLDWAASEEFFSITRTADELSVVCCEGSIPAGVKAEQGWVCFKLEGPFPFSLTGILASFISPLADAAIPVFAVSTYDTDYVLIKEENAGAALDALRAAGHQLLRA